MPPAARETDLTTHGGVIVEGSPDVFIGWLPAARLLDKHVCPLHGPGPITESSATVFINKMGAARQGDACTCMVPSTKAGGGSSSSSPNAQFKMNIERKQNVKEEAIDKVKEGKDAWKDKPPKDPVTKVTASLSKEFGKADSMGSDDHFQWFAGKRGGTATASYETELKNLKNAKADANVKYEVEGSVARAQGQLGDVKKGDIAQVKGEGKLLTAKASAQGGATLDVKNGVLKQASIGGEAGIGASVVEGKVSGQTKAFKLPFVNYGISFNGEASGALLTAEAKASAMAGYKDGKWTFGFGAKIGAALAGLGFKFGFTIERLPPPAPPPEPPGVPGFAGIDPIAMGCFTVLIGGMPPPYIPGPPTKADYGGHVIGSPGDRNAPGTMESKADPVEERRIQNKELAMQILPDGRTRLQADAAKVGVTAERLQAMTEGKCPLSFPTPEIFHEFKKELREVMDAIGLADSVLRLKGTSTTFYSENPGKPLGHHFDANPKEPADVDIGIESKALTTQMARAGVQPNPKIPTIFKTKDVMKQQPKLQAFSEKWTRKLGRDVNFVGLVDPSKPPAAPTDYLL